MNIPKRKDCEHNQVYKYDDCMCPTECGHFTERSDNSGYAVQSTASPKLTDSQNAFCHHCGDENVPLVGGKICESCYLAHSPNGIYL